jgi:phosphoglycolate phosphatase
MSPVQPALRLAVFDLDGTLVDSVHMIEAAMREAFATLGLPAPDPAEVRRIIGLPLEIAISRLEPSLDAVALDQVGESYKATFAALRAAGEGGEALFPDVARTLAALDAAGWLLAIATSKSMRGLTATLRNFGLAHHFVTLRTADHGPAKPAPDMLLSALSETGVEAGDAVMIGDTTYDMEMARAARVAAIGVGWGYHPADELRAAGAAAIAPSMSALPALAEEVLMGPVTS